MTECRVCGADVDPDRFWRCTECGVIDPEAGGDTAGDDVGRRA